MVDRLRQMVDLNREVTSELDRDLTGERASQSRSGPRVQFSPLDQVLDLLAAAERRVWELENNLEPTGTQGRAGAPGGGGGGGGGAAPGMERLMELRHARGGLPEAQGPLSARAAFAADMAALNAILAVQRLQAGRGPTFVVNPPKPGARGLTEEEFARLPEVPPQLGEDLDYIDCPVCLHALSQPPPHVTPRRTPSPSGQLAPPPPPDGRNVLNQLPCCRACFHSPCLKGWLLRTPTCPLCRKVQRPPSCPVRQPSFRAPPRPSPPASPPSARRSPGHLSPVPPVPPLAAAELPPPLLPRRPLLPPPTPSTAATPPGTPPPIEPPQEAARLEDPPPRRLRTPSQQAPPPPSNVQPLSQHAPAHRPPPHAPSPASPPPPPVGEEPPSAPPREAAFVPPMLQRSRTAVQRAVPQEPATVPPTNSAPGTPAPLPQAEVRRHSARNSRRLSTWTRGMLGATPDETQANALAMLSRRRSSVMITQPPPNMSALVGRPDGR